MAHTIEDVQERADGGYYAVIDGKDAEFIGDGDTNFRTPCDQCGAVAELNADGDVIRDVLGDCIGNSVLICTQCLELARAAAKW